jgi:hypothetical protein
MAMESSGTDRGWKREQLVAVLSLYCRTPFGRLHKTNPEIVALAAKIGRTPSAVAMKASNFASLDPVLEARGIKGLDGASKQDRAIWAELHGDSENFAAESEEAYENLHIQEDDDVDDIAALDNIVIPAGPTETTAVVRVRRVQKFFRRTVRIAYGGACAVCDFDIKRMLVASHIIGWAADERRRADPTNGLLLCVLHDRAFDQAFMTFDADLHVRISPKLKNARSTALQKPAFLDYDGRPLRSPERFAPDPAALEHHRRVVCGDWYGS